MMSEKKKKGCWQLGGLLPISQSWSQYSTLYRDTARAPGYETAERVHAGARSRATIWPAKGMTWSACAQGVLQRARSHGLARGDSRYKNCIVDGGDRLCRNMVMQGCYTMLRHGLRYIRGVRTTRRVVCAAGVGSRYSFCIVTGGGSGHDNVRTRPGL